MLIGLAIRWYMTKSRLQARQDTDGAYEPTCGGNSTASALTPQNAFLGYTFSVNNAIVAAGAVAARCILPEDPDLPARDRACD